MEYIRNTSEVVSGLQQVFIPMGGDFQYISGEDNYQWMDDLMHTMNMKISKNRMHFMYSTPHCYLKALMAEKPYWLKRTGDFFPYISSNIIYRTRASNNRSALVTA